MTLPTAEPARAADLCFASMRARGLAPNSGAAIPCNAGGPEALDAARRHDLGLPGVTSRSAPPAAGWIAAFR